MGNKYPLQNIREEDYRSRYPGTADLDLQIRKLSIHGRTAVQIALEIPCSESTVYRSLRRMQDFLSTQNYTLFLKYLRESINQDPPNFGDSNTHSPLEMLYAAYADNNEHEPAECNAGFVALDTVLSDLPLEVSDPIFDKVCILCSCYERSGFTEGFKLGVHMANELSA